MARALGYSLWGHSPDGRIRLGSAKSDGPTGALSDDQIREEFGKHFLVVQSPNRRNGELIIQRREHCACDLCRTERAATEAVKGGA